MQNWSLDISRQSDWDLWSWLCIAAAGVLVVSLVRRGLGRDVSGQSSLLFGIAGIAGTALVLGIPGLRTARVGLFWTFILLSLVALTFYLNLRGRLSRRQLLSLLVIRIAVIAALVPMLFEPVLRWVRMPAPDRPLIFLVDRSGSMSFADTPDGVDRVRRVWRALEPELGRLRQHFVPQVITFATDIRPLPTPAALADTKADGRATDLTGAVRQATSSTPRDDALVVLLSDGIDNTAPDVVTAMTDLRRRIHTVAVGSETAATTALANVAVVDVRIDEELAAGHEVSVQATVRSTALPGRVVTVNLAETSESGTPVGEPRRTTLVLQPTPQGQQVTLPFTATTAGTLRLAVWVDASTGERTLDDNRQDVRALAVDPAIRVLYVEGRLRPEFRDLRRLLESDPNVEAATLLRVQANRFVASGTVNRKPLPERMPTPAEWAAFDVIILGDLDASFLSSDDQQAIERAVSAGKSLLMIGGEKSFAAGGYDGTAIAKALPVVMGPANTPQEAGRFVPRLTTGGASHPAMEGLAPFFGVEADPPSQPLPQLNGNVVVAGETGGAQVLLTHPGKAGAAGKPQIVLAVQRYGQGRSAALTVHSTYLWALPMAGLGQDSPYNRLWGQLIRWLAGTDVRNRQRGSGVDALLHRSLFQPQESVRVRAVVRDKQGNATRYAQVAVQVWSTDTTSATQATADRSVVANPVDGRNGLYEAVIPPMAQGNYVATVKAEKDGGVLGSSDVRFVVVPPQDEMLELSADPTLLRRIAAETRGSAYQLDRFPELVDELVRTEANTRPEQVTARLASFPHAAGTLAGLRVGWPREYDLPMQGAIVVALLTVEWVLRRRWQVG